MWRGYARQLVVANWEMCKSFAVNTPETERPARRRRAANPQVSDTPLKQPRSVNAQPVKPQASQLQAGKRPVGRPRKTRPVDMQLSEVASPPLADQNAQVGKPTAADLMELKIPGSTAFRAIRDLMGVDPAMSLSRREATNNRMQRALLSLAEHDRPAGEEALRLVRRLHRHMTEHPNLNLRALCVQVTAQCPDTQGGSSSLEGRLLRALDLVDEFLHQQSARLD